MKIVFAPIPSQEKEINGLVRYIYSNIFPLYFTDEEIYQFEHLKILHPSEDFNTLKDAFQVMTNIQTLISILESSSLDVEYTSIFNKNVENLQEFGLTFPFQYEQFVEAKRMKINMLSIYSKADNQLLV